MTYEEQVKVAKASIVMGTFIIFFAISLMIGLSYLVLSSNYIPNLLLIPFILFPTIILIVSLVRIVRYVRFLKSEPPSSEE